jgi:hypothetical protein
MPSQSAAMYYANSRAEMTTTGKIMSIGQGAQLRELKTVERIFIRFHFNSSMIRAMTLHAQCRH